jgi:flagellar assembly protein FliH
VKLDTAAEPVVNQFNFGKISRGASGYEATKARYGSLAATDEHVVDRAQKDRRFSINPLLRNPLSIEDEERRVIDERVRAQIEALTEAAKKQGQEAGFAEGLKAGQEASFKQFQADASERLASLQALLGSLEGMKSEFLKANEKFLLELVFKISKMILLKEIATDKTYLLRLVQEAVEKTGMKEFIHVKISPTDAESLEMLKSSLEKDYRGFSIETSPEVELGGCRVETEWNAIDASLGTQLEAIHQALVGERT